MGGQADRDSFLASAEQLSTLDDLCLLQFIKSSYVVCVESHASALGLSKSICLLSDSKSNTSAVCGSFGYFIKLVFTDSAPILH